MSECTDPVALNLWHAICARDEMDPNEARETVLLGQAIAYVLDDRGIPSAWRSDDGPATAAPSRGSDARALPARLAYGYLWTSLGRPPDEIFSISEYAEPDRRCLNAATLGVSVSAPRAIENFLDLAHFPFVHTDILGKEPHTEVEDYDVELSAGRNEILATRCRFFQPKAAATADRGAEIEYVYRVPHPFCSVLYKSSPVDESRRDVIALFVQPVDQERCRAHMMLCILDAANRDKDIRQFQQTVLAQDKPILENQLPKRLPLDPGAETPIRADKSAIAYRRWLSRMGLTYGVIPATDR